METLHFFIISLLAIGFSLMAIRLDEEREVFYMIKYTPQDLLLLFTLRVVTLVILMSVMTKLFIN